MSNSIVENLAQCNKLFEDKSNIVVLMVFLVSYLIFSFLFKEEKPSSEIRTIRQRQAEQYLKLHEQEDQDFFFGNTN